MLENLKKSIHEMVDEGTIAQIIATKDLINTLQDEGKKVAILLVTGDVTNASHIQYINTARQAMIDILGEDSKLFVGVESDGTTMMRKEKKNVYSDIERKYIFENLKGVDHAFISFSNNEKRPYGSTMYLDPDLLISHEEYFPDMRGAEDVSRKLKELGSKFHVVRYDDTIADKESGIKFRENINRTTTNTIKQIFSLYSDNPKYNERLSS